MTDKANTLIQEIWKIVQTIIIVAVIPWSVWITNWAYTSKAFIEQGPRYTTKDAQIMELRIYRNMSSMYPPLKIISDIDSIKKDLEEIKISLARKNIR